MPEERQTPEIQTPQAPPAVHDKRSLPEGVVPKQAQGYVIAGLAVLILLAVMFSKNHASPAPKSAVQAPMVVSTDANQRKIRELEQDLSADQRQVQRAQKAGGNVAVPGSNASSTPSGDATAPATQSPLPPAEPPRDPVKDAERELAFRSRFVSNLVSADVGTTRPASDQAESGSALAARSASSSPQASAPLPSGNKRAPEVNVNSAHGQPYVVFEGTIIDTVLTNRLDGEFAGPVKVMVTNPVYSRDRQHVLIPEGTFILGDVQRVSNFGQKRLAVTFHRLLMPDGYSVDLDQFHGLDQIGDTGLKDKTNSHYLQIFGTSIALGIISGAAEATNNNAGYNISGSEAYKSGVASSLSQSSANVLDKFINIPPTITIREGHRIKIYITQDMLLPAYENHTIPGDI